MKLHSESGWTLTELMASIVLVGILSLGFATAMMTFVANYYETRDFMRLQQDMWYAMNAIRQGYIRPGFASQQSRTPGLIGLLTAQSVNIETEREVLTLYPLDASAGEVGGNWSRFTRNKTTGELICDAQYRYTYIHNAVVFPSSKAKINKKEPKYQITKFLIEDLTPANRPKTALVKITLVGQVRFRPRGRNQNSEDDIKKNTRSAQLETIVYVGHANTG